MKAVRILVLAAMAAVLATFGAGAAVAAPTPTSVPATCVTYPIQVCQAHIMSSTTTPFQGQTIEVSGRGYKADEDVALTIGGIAVGTAHTDGNGNFDPAVVVPASLIGDQPLTGRGASGLAWDVDSLVLDIRAAGAGGSSASSGGGLASTGVDVVAGLAVALALIGAGLLLSRSGRRRHAQH